MRVNRIVKQAGGLGIEQLDPLRQEGRGPPLKVLRDSMLMKSAVGVDVEDPGVFVKSLLELADIIVVESIDVETHHAKDRVVVIGSRGHGDP